MSSSKEPLKLEKHSFTQNDKGFPLTLPVLNWDCFSIMAVMLGCSKSATIVDGTPLCFIPFFLICFKERQLL